MDFPTKKYPLIYADPPWQYGNFNDPTLTYGGLANKHYDTMTYNDLMELPVKSIAEDDAILFLWVTWPILCSDMLDLHALVKAWGFEPKTLGFIWVKTNKNTGTPFFGMGTYTAANSEPCLLCTRGKPKKLINSNRVSQVIMSPLQQHSKKPDKVRNEIVRLCGNIPRIELFARIKPHGWDAWGNDPKLDHKPLEAF